jgi:cell fate regulator YaaT (PSP1 superfamily)
MPEVIGIRFKNCGRIYDFEVNGLELQKGSRVIVESEFGLSIGTVVDGVRRHVENPEKELKKVLRLAGEEDLRQKKENQQFEKEARDFCLERIMARGLPMRLVCSEVTLDRKRIMFYFTAEGRIDFRELVKDLAARFKTRIEMRQIGVRDKAKLVGGLGLCGKELCCRLFLTSFEPISIRMAKQQDLVLNTGKLSGICGRLMCCLGYEYDDKGSEAPSAREETSPPETEESLKAVKEEAVPPLAEVKCCTMETRTAIPRPEEIPAEGRKEEHGKRRRKRKRFRKKAKTSE